MLLWDADDFPKAISTLLQPPIVRTGLLPHTSVPSSYKPPSTRDIPPVTLTNVPHINASAFKPYLTQVGSLYDAFRKAKDDSGEVKPSSSRRSSKGDSGTTEASIHGFRRRLSQTHDLPGTRSLTPPISSPAEAPHVKRNVSGGVPRRAGPTVAPLSTIPNVYFDQDFHLENPRTFDIVSERAEIARPSTGAKGANGAAILPASSGKKALATNAILQEKLSWYMDTVEIHLISSISSASSSFFAALGSLRDLHSEAAQSVAKVISLRSDLAKLDRDMAEGGLKIVSMKKRRENARVLGHAVQQLERVVSALSMCGEQVEKGEIEVALKDLANVEMLIAGEPRERTISIQSPERNQHQSTLIDLRGIKALEGVGNDIRYLRQRIGRSFESRFLDTLLGDIRSHTASVPANSTFQRWGKTSNRFRGSDVRTPAEFPAFLHVDGELRNALLVQLKGLARSDSIMQAAIAYREAILREFKKLIQKHLPSSSDDDIESTVSSATQNSRHRTQQEKSSILIRNLRDLEAEDAEDMFRKVYSSIGEALRRLGTQVKVLLDITSSLGNPYPMASLKSPQRSPMVISLNDFANPEPSPGPEPALVKQEEIQQALDLSSLLGQAVDIAQAQITKILKIRMEQSTHLDLLAFLRYFTLNKLFADECEAVSGRGGNALKTVVNEHIKAFVSNISESERQSLLQKIDEDRWDAKDFTDEDSKRLDQIINASTQDISEWTRSSIIWEDGVKTSIQPLGDAQLSSHDHASSTEQMLPNGQSGSNGVTVNGVSKFKDKIRPAIVEEQKYLLPESAIAVARGIEVFEHLLTGIPSMAQETSSSLLEYLKLFNSRTSQMILGAGATRSAGLKNITAKHLALSSQSLSFVITLIPYIRECVRRHASNQGNPMAEFDRVKRLFQEHQSGIHDKLVDILTGRAAAHIGTMKRINWDTLDTGPAVNGYMETLIKETTTLHRVLSKHLPEMTVQSIMQQVLANYKEQWSTALRDVVLKTPAGKIRYGMQNFGIPFLYV